MALFFIVKNYLKFRNSHVESNAAGLDMLGKTARSVKTYKWQN
jgi:hypothetical protein